jgi:hypothetical protein
MEKFRVKCSKCGAVLQDNCDKAPAPKFAKCPTCNGDIKTEKYEVEDKKGMDFDVIVVNKRTNTSRRAGCFISAEEVGSEKKNKEILTKRLAGALATIVTSPNLGELMKDG